MMFPNPTDGPKPRVSISAPDLGGEIEVAHPYSPTAPHPAMPQTLAPAPNFGALLVSIRRRWFLALALGILSGGAIAFGAWKFVPEAKYQVRTMVHLSAVPETILSRPHEGEAQFAYLQKTQITLVKSHVVLETVLQQPEVARLRVVLQQAAPKEWLFGMIEADFKQGPEVLTISMKGNTPEDLTLLVNAVTKAYLSEFVNLEGKRRQSRLEKLTELEKQQQVELSKKRERLNKLAPAMGGGDPQLIGGLHGGILKQIGSVHEELQGVQGDRTRLSLVVQRLEKQLAAARSAKEPSNSALIDLEVNQDTRVKYHLEEIQKLDILIARTRRVSSSQKAAEEALRQNRYLENLQEHKEDLEARRKELRAEVTARLKAKREEELESELGRNADQLAYASEREKRLLATLTTLNKQATDKGEEAFRLAQLVREVEEEEKILNSILKEIRTLRVDMGAPPRAKPLDEAVVTTNVGKKRLLLTGAGGAGMFFAAVAGVGLWEFRKRKVECVDEVIFGFGIGVVGTLPTIQRRRRSSQADRMLGWSGYIDSFRTILLRGEVNPKARVVLVTSAEAGEGKTSLASHLAISLARSGRKTLLLDCDTRNPTAHKLFNLSRSPGWNQVLAAELSFDEAALPSGVAGLWVLPAGEYRPEAHNHLSTEHSAKLFGLLRQRFDSIVVDSCPILPVADTLHLAPCTDGVVFSILRHRSRLPKVSAALHRLRMLGVPILGAVVSGTDEDVYSSGYYSPLVNADR